MRIWLPFVSAGSGADVFTTRLADSLKSLGHEVVLTPFDRLFQYFPWRLSLAAPPKETSIIVANASNAFAFRRRPCQLIAIEHHCVFDPVYAPYRSWAQSLYHEKLLRSFERASFAAADAVVTPSRYTADTLVRVFAMPQPNVILNGVDTNYFCPQPADAARERDRPFRLLFVGNLSRRKGVDLLPKIMQRLGPGFELRYTLGLRNGDPIAGQGAMTPLAPMKPAELRQQYREADLLLFPTRYEGFGYAVAEAMACGTPAVASNCSSLPEIVENGVSGSLCPTDDIKAFAAAICRLRDRPDELAAMGRKARDRSVIRFNLTNWAETYVRLFERLLSKAPQDSAEACR
jgi:glycosyltransferase involved in cell wall biosynthesis